jgi:acetyltransferase-like isoleucine patch superfamily enzyme
MSAKAKLWEWILDPLVRKLESRLAHFESLRVTTHEGGKWGRIANIGSGAMFYSESLLANTGPPEQLKIGEHSCIRGEVVVTGSAAFRIGHHCFLGPGSRIWCSRGITIGDHVLISHLVDIHDSDSHSKDWRARRDEGVALFERGTPSPGHDVRKAPIVIEDDVWIGFKSSILKGVTIGRGAVVAACSVVTKDVAPYTLVGGNPARVIADLTSHSVDRTSGPIPGGGQ